MDCICNNAIAIKYYNFVFRDLGLTAGGTDDDPVESALIIYDELPKTFTIFGKDVFTIRNCQGNTLTAQKNKIERIVGVSFLLCSVVIIF